MALEASVEKGLLAPPSHEHVMVACLATPLLLKVANPYQHSATRLNFWIKLVNDGEPGRLGW